MEKLLLTVNDVVAATSLSRTGVFALFKSGSIKVTKVGNRTFVRRCDLINFVNSLGDENVSS